MIDVEALRRAGRPVVAVTGEIHPVGLALLERHCAVAALYAAESAEAAAAIWPLADGVVVRTELLTAPMLERCPRLKVIGKHGVGVDNIDVAAATRLGIPVLNTPGANALAVAECAVALMLAVLKRIREAHALVAEGRFAERGPWRAGDLSGRTLGLVGGGRIARHLARICGKGFGMPILVFDPYLSAEEAAAMGAEKVERLADMLQRADVVSIHTPLTQETRGLIGPLELARMKRGAILVNAARGGIVDEAALAEALAAGRLRGAGLDVFASEPPEEDNPLLGLPNVVLSPHVAGISEESARRMAEGAVGGVLDVLAGRKPEALLNPEIWDRRRR